MNISIYMDRRSIILVPSCFSHQDASSDIHYNPIGPILQFGPVQVKISILLWTFHQVWGNTAKVGGATRMLQIFRKFSLYRSLIRKTARTKKRNVSLIYDHRNKQHFLVLLRPI